MHSSEVARGGPELGAAGATGFEPERPEEPVERVLYASRAHVPGAIYAEMERIRASAVRHNAPLRVHTALLHQAGWFVQWKEGPSEAIGALMEHVARDRRHSHLQLLHRSHGPRLLPGLWSMAIVQCRDTAEEFGQRVAALHQWHLHGTQPVPMAAWRLLSTPLRHPGAALQHEADAFQRVLVCSAMGDDAFGCVRWLGAATRQEVVRRRFAGEQHLDVATDYVDFEDGQRVMRFIAMARNGLSLGLTRAFLGDYSHAVLLLSGQHARDAELLERVQQACVHLQAPLPLLGVGPVQSLQRLGLRGVVTAGGGLLGPSDWQCVWPALAAALRAARAP